MHLQNQLKGMFVGSYMVGNISLFALALSKLAGHGSTLAWGGAALASGSVSALFGLMYAGRLPRTSPRLDGLRLAVLFGTVIAAFAWHQQGYAFTGEEFQAFSASSLIALVGTLAYVSWYSRLGRSETPSLAVGKSLPAIHFTDESGATVALDQFRGKPALLVFYRGNWCPLCMAQTRELADQCREFLERDINVLLISPQSSRNSAKLARRLGVPFRFLSDPQGLAAASLGITHKSGLPLGLQIFGYASDTVYPTVIAIDEAGIVLLIDQTDNYRVRPTLDELLSAFDDKATPKPAGATTASAANTPMAEA